MNFYKIFTQRLFLGLMACGVALSTHAQDPLMEREHLFGDWGGLRSSLEENGLKAELVYTAEYFENLNGGIKEGGDYRGDVSLFLELDTQKVGWWDGGEFFVHVQEQHGEAITERYVGDFQGVSNIDADHFLQISEFWYKHYFMDDKVWVKVGKQDANAEFVFVDFGGEFLNSSPGTHPSVPIATFPDQDWGAIVGFEPNQKLSVHVGAFQSRPNGGRSLGNTLDKLHGPTLLIEPILHYDLGEKPGHFHFGYWINDDEIERLDGSDSTSSTDGFYLSVDQVLFLENDVDEQGLGIFAQYAKSDEDYIEAETYYGAGLQWIGLLDFRDEDVAGFGIYHVELSDDGGFDKDSETIYEVFYKIQVNPWCSVKPDLQYVVNPGGTDASDATVVGIRAEIIF